MQHDRQFYSYKFAEKLALKFFQSIFVNHSIEHIKMKKICILGFILPFLLLTSCEDVVQIDVTPGETQLVVDAFLNNLKSKQKVQLTLTAPYFDNKPAPTVSGAKVFVENLTSKERFDFTETSPGEYVFEPDAAKVFIALENEYMLNVEYSGERFYAHSFANRTTKSDSVVTTFEEERIGRKKGFYAEMFGRDIKGKTDFYWIKTFRNDVFLGKPEYLNIARDAVPNGSSNGTDGLTFIPPIRRRVTDFDNPFQEGDKIRIEIHSLTKETHDYLSQVQTQILNGGLFAVQPNNVATNIKNVSEKGKKAVGWFSVSLVEFLEKEVK